MSKRALLVILLGGLVTVAMSWAVNAWLKADSCLDLGGRWDARTGECETIIEATSSPLIRMAMDDNSAARS